MKEVFAQREQHLGGMGLVILPFRKSIIGFNLRANIRWHTVFDDRRDRLKKIFGDVAAPFAECENLFELVEDENGAYHCRAVLADKSAIRVVQK